MCRVLRREIGDKPDKVGEGYLAVIGREDVLYSSGLPNLSGLPLIRSPHLEVDATECERYRGGCDSHIEV